MPGKKTKEGDVRTLPKKLSQFVEGQLSPDKEFALKAWLAVTEQLQGMTADMARDFCDVEFDGAYSFVVTLSDKVNRDFCSKPERKKLIATVLSEVVGKKSMAVDFLVAKGRPSVASRRTPTLAERNREALAAAGKHLDSLSKTWADIETALLREGVLSPVEIKISNEYDDDGMILGENEFGLQKINGRWRICCRYFHFSAADTFQAWTPVTEASIENRIELIDHVDDLRKAIVNGNEACVSRIEEANKKSKAILKRLRE